MDKVKKMAFGGGANLPVQAQAAMNNPMATGLDRAAMMSGRTMPTPGVGMRPQGMKKGGSVSAASKRADGCAMRGKTKGKMV